MYEPKRFKYSDPLDSRRNVLQTCFNLEEKARYSQLLKEFSANARRFLAESATKSSFFQESPEPCSSQEPTSEKSSSSVSPVMKKDFSRLTEKFNSDPQRLCHIIRNEYLPHAQIRKKEADRLLVEAKLRLEARRAQQVSLEDEIRLRIRLEGLILPEKDAEEPDLVPLSDEQLELVRSAFRNNENDVLIDKFNIKITRHDLTTLQGSNWLNDEVINFYFNLIMERSTREKLPTVHVFNTFFYPKLQSSGYAALRRWTRQVDIFSRDLLFVPVHVGGMHWCLGVIDFRRKLLSYYDSMKSSDKNCLLILKKYLKDESFDKKKIEFDDSGWEYVVMQKIPQQMNGSDCGVFACKFADYISRGATINFTQENMPYFRTRIMYEILTGRLL